MKGWGWTLETRDWGVTLTVRHWNTYNSSSTIIKHTCTLNTACKHLYMQWQKLSRYLSRGLESKANVCHRTSLLHLSENHLLRVLENALLLLVRPFILWTGKACWWRKVATKGYTNWDRPPITKYMVHDTENLTFSTDYRADNLQVASQLSAYICADN